MKKHIIVIYFLLMNLAGYSQNWQCFQTGIVQYFTNNNGYLRAMRIDSVHVIGDTTYYYPFKTLRASPTSYLPFGSWLGGTVKQAGDGTTIFDNFYENKTVTILTLAGIGASWIFCTDSTNQYYSATVSAVDTMTVMGMTDSIKTMTINAYLNGSLNTNDSMNNAQLVLSKAHGFVQVPDLYFFPYHYPGANYYPGTDAYLDIISNYFPGQSTVEFSQTNFIIPTWQSIYDFNVGDVFENHIVTYLTCIAPDSIGYEIDSVIYKNVLDSFHTVYAIQRCTYMMEAYGCCTWRQGCWVDTFRTDTSQILNMYYLPEQAVDSADINDPYIYYYFPIDTTFCTDGAKYEKLTFTVFEGCYNGSIFKNGFERLFYGTCYSDTFGMCGFPIAAQYYDTMIYAKKAGGTSVTCGAFVALDSKNVSILSELFIYPNPVSDELNIINTSTDQYEIIMCNLLGQIVLTKTSNTKEETIDVGNLRAGIYELIVIDIDGNRIVKKVIISH